MLASWSRLEVLGGTERINLILPESNPGATRAGARLNLASFVISMMIMLKASADDKTAMKVP